MRLTLTLAAVAAAVLAASAAQAQDPTKDGEYRADLLSMISQTAAGACPADLMAPELLAECEAQIWQVGPALAQLGPVATLTLVRTEGEGADKVEVYEATHQSGQVLNWGLGARVDGKYTTAYAGGGG